MKAKVSLKNITGKKYGYLLAPFLSGIIIISAHPPFEQGYMAWVALLPLLWTCLQVSPRQAFWAGFIFGLPFNLYVNLYLANVLYPYLSDLLATIAMTALVVYTSLFYGVFALATALIKNAAKPWLAALAVPSIWLVVEYLRSLSFLAYNVGYLGYTQWQYPVLLNIASVYGYWGLPFLIVFFQTIILLSYRQELRKKSLFTVASVFVFLLAAGLIVPVLQPVASERSPLRVALIQGNIAPELVIDRNRHEIVDHYLDLTRAALTSDPAVEMVVWPETVVHLDFRVEEKHPPNLARLAAEHEVDLLYGARIRREDNLYNSITLLSKNQEAIPVYNKQRLVPFVEFFPAEQLLNQILQLDLLLGSYTAGDDITIFEVDGIKVSGVVCFESYFGDHMRLFAKQGSRHQFVVTNDAWFGESIGLEQHAQVAAIRAAEAGRGVTQVANSGITISFDYRGRELFRSGKSEQAVFILPLDMTTRETIYTRFGDFFPAFWSVFLIITVPVLLFKTSRGSF